MNAPPSLSKVEQVRARDGDGCWLCTRPLDFTAVPNSKNAPTIEHLLAKSLGGGDQLANLVLCHKACNLHLADRPVAKKEEMRVKFHINAAKIAATRSASPSQAPESEQPAKTASPHHASAGENPNKTVVYQADSLPKEQLQHSSKVRPAREDLGAEVAYWRRLALVGGGAGLVSFGFTLGLCVALVVR